MEQIAILFPGQGVQYTGMGKYMYDSFDMAKEIFHRASDSCGFDMAKLCFEGESEKLAQTEYTQPAVLTVGYAACRILTEEYGYAISYGAGHSLGEITALASAGVIDFVEAVKLVKIRGKLMQDAAFDGEGAMSAIVGIEPYLVRKVCEEMTKQNLRVEVSNYNSPVQTVISGHKQAVRKAEESFLELGGKAVRLKVSAPFHCSLMKPAQEKFQAELHKIQFQKPKFPVLSNITGLPYREKSEIPDMLVRQLIYPVEWTKIMKFLSLSGVTFFIDAGPGNMIKNLVKANIHFTKVFSFDKDFGELRREKGDAK